MNNYKILTDCNGKILLESDGKILVLKSNSLNLEQIIKSNIVHPLFRVYLLNYDESIREDITSELKMGGNISITLDNGQRRSANIQLLNNNRKWFPNPVQGRMWKGVKFRIDVGIKVASDEYWNTVGIFVVNDPDIFNNPEEKYINLQLSDKFASLDGTLGGRITNTVNVPVGSNIKEAAETLLKEERIAGMPYDPQSIVFPIKYLDAVTPYTLTKSEESNIGEILTDLAAMINCNVYYNEFGHLIFEDNDDTLQVNYKTPLWHFTDEDSECLGSSMQVKFSEIYNVITVVGANINGAIMDYTIENTSASSPSNIYVTEPHRLKITDDNIASVDLARQRAEYELFKQGLLKLALNFNTVFMPHLNVNQIVSVTNKFYGFVETPFLIQSIQIPISYDSKLSLSMSNVNEVVLK